MSRLEAKNTGSTKSGNRSLGRLYDDPFKSSRTGALYNAFSYPTKIDAEAVAIFIAAHTSPGDVVLDPFGGSGSTGIAACLCDQPTDRMRQMATAVGLCPKWGPRKALLYELSPMGAFLAEVMTHPPDPDEFRKVATQLITSATADLSWMYGATSPSGEPGLIRHIIWSEVLETPCCASKVSFFDVAVSRHPLAIRELFRCPACQKRVRTSDCRRAVRRARDIFSGKLRLERERRPAFVYGRSPAGTWSRPINDSDLAILRRIAHKPVPSGAPQCAIAWGDLYRSGYHFGMTHLHHLYTQRNFRVLAELWNRVRAIDGPMGDALRLLVLSYNSSHSTLMTRVVVKTGQSDFVITGAQSGVLYVSGLPVEKNILAGIQRKIGTFSDAFALTHGTRSEVTIVNASSTKLNCASGSIDYVFTDPPFGDFIPYAEINALNEAWLGTLTNRDEEAIVSPAQGKGSSEYAALLTRVFQEVSRALHANGAATVIFHASKPAVWGALAEAFQESGFAVQRTSVLEKTQLSFKQAVHDGGTRGDAVLLLGHSNGHAHRATCTSTTALEAAMSLDVPGSDEAVPRRMYSRYVAHCMRMQVPVSMSATEFYKEVRERRVGKRHPR